MTDLFDLDELADAAVASARGLYDSLPTVQKVKDDVASFAAEQAFAMLPVNPVWVLNQVDEDIVPNVAAMAEGLLLGVFEVRPKTVTEAVNDSNNIVYRIAHSATPAILLLNGDDLLWGMGEGIVDEFSETLDMLYKIFDWDTWEKLPGEILKVINLFCGDRDTARSVGFEIGKALAGSLKSTVLGPDDEFARSVGRIIGPIVLELVIAYLTAGLGLVVAGSKYGLKATRWGLKLGDKALDALQGVTKGRRLELPSADLDKVVTVPSVKAAPVDLPKTPTAKPKTEVPKVPGEAVPEPPARRTQTKRDEPSKKREQRERERTDTTTGNVHRGLADPDLHSPPPKSVTERPPATRASDVESEKKTADKPDTKTEAEPEAKEPRRGTNVRTLTAQQEKDIKKWATHFTRDNRNPGVKPEDLIRGVTSACKKWPKFDIDHPESLKELAKLYAMTLRRQTKSGRNSYVGNLMGAVGELRFLGVLNKSPSVKRVRMVESAGGKGKTPDFTIELEGSELFDVEVTTYMQGTFRKRVNKKTDATRRRLAASPFDSKKASDAFIAKMKKGQLRRTGGPGRGAIAVNSYTPPRAELFTEVDLARMRKVMDKNPEVHELWLIGPGGEVVPVLRKEGSGLLSNLALGQ